MKLRPFELVLIVVFIILAIAALILLTTYSGKDNDSDDPSLFVGSVQIWGTIPQNSMNQVLMSIAQLNKSFMGVSYRHIPSEDFDEVLTNALADEKGPDIILISQEHLVEQRRRIQAFAYESFPIRDLQTNYLDGAQVYALSDGMYGYPVLVDPLMMFWNRNILSNKGLLNPPVTWEELVNVQFPELIERGFDRTINKSVIAMGEYDNIRNSFGVISMLLLQSGTKGVIEDNGEYKVLLQTAVSNESQPLRNSLDFYLRFNKPSNALYSWNRSFTEDRTQFISEDLVFYFGFASEGKEIERLNPNLSFDIAEVPQGASADVRRTYARIYALSPLRSSDNLSGAYSVMSTLGSAANVEKMAEVFGMSPALRSSVTKGSNDIYGRLAYKSAPIAYGWLNPQIDATDSVFRKVTSDINENRRTLELGVLDTVKSLEEQY